MKEFKAYNVDTHQVAQGIVLNNGGLKSAACLHSAVIDCGALATTSVFVDFGLKSSHQKMRSAQTLASFYGVKHSLVVDASKIFKGFNSSRLLTSSQGAVPDKEFDINKELPFYYELLAYIGGTIGKSTVKKECARIYMGLTDPDICSHINDALCVTTRSRKFGTNFPLNGIGGKKMMKMLVDEDVPMERTTSCIDSNVPCGRCVGCLRRAKLFESIHMADPMLEALKEDTEYEAF